MKNELINAFNTWLDDYINHPEMFENDWKMIKRHLGEADNGEPQSYGAMCVAYLEKKMGKGISG